MTARSLASAALLVSDASAFAIVGLSPRQFRTLVRKRGIPRTKVGRRTLVRADVLLMALGLDGSPEATVPAVPVWSPATVLRALRGGRA